MGFTLINGLHQRTDDQRTHKNRRIFPAQPDLGHFFHGSFDNHRHGQGHITGIQKIAFLYRFRSGKDQKSNLSSRDRIGPG